MLSRRSLLLSATTLAFALGLLVLPVLAAELLGTIKSVNVEGNKFVVTANDKDTEISVNDNTAWESAKGKAIKKSPIARLKTGGEVEVTHEAGVASKVVLKKGALKKKDAN